MKKSAVVIHSGGMDSSLCLALAIRDFGVDQVLSLSFDYDQRQTPELEQAAKICRDWNVDHTVLKIDCLKKISRDALTDHTLKIEHNKGGVPNTLVSGRNGLMAHIGGIHAGQLGARCIYMGVLELEGANSGYYDCSRHYMDLKQSSLRIDLNQPLFEIRTPLIKMTKKETLELAHSLGILDYLLEETITCYEGKRYRGCEVCPSCLLRNGGIREFIKSNPSFKLPYRDFV